MGTAQEEQHQRVPEARGEDKRPESRCHHCLQGKAEHDRPRLRNDDVENGKAVEKRIIAEGYEMVNG